MTPTDLVASSTTVTILTHEEFTAKHPHPPIPYRVTRKDIDRNHEPVPDRQRDSTNDRHETFIIIQRAPLNHRVQLPKIDVVRLNALRNPSQPSEESTDNVSEQSEDASETM